MRSLRAVMLALSGVVMLAACGLASGLPGSTQGAYATQGEMNAILAHRNQAIKSGNHEEYVEDVDPGHSSLVQQEKMAFQNIEALHFSTYRLVSEWNNRYPKGTSKNPFDAPVAIPFPLPYDVTQFLVVAYVATPGMKPTANAYQYLLARVNGSFRIINIILGAPDQAEERQMPWSNPPWELTPLSVIRTGDVVVAGDATVSDLSTYATDATRADAVIRGFWGSRPSPQISTLFFTKSPQTFAEWFNPGNVSNFEGLTFPLYGVQVQSGVPVAQISQYVGAWVTVNLASALISQEDPYQVVKHEMTHALTVEAWNPHLVGGGPAGPNGTLVSGVSDWATEGFARWSETAESPSARQAVDDDVAQGVSAGRFAGKLPSDSKFYDPNANTMAFNYDLAATIFQFIAEKWGTANAVAVYADTVASGDMGMTNDAYAPGTDLEQALDKENLVPSSFTDPFWGMWQSYVQQLG